MSLHALCTVKNLCVAPYAYYWPNCYLSSAQVTVSIVVDLDENKAFYNTRQLDELLQFTDIWLSRDYILRFLFGEKQGVCVCVCVCASVSMRVHLS